MAAWSTRRLAHLSSCGPTLRLVAHDVYKMINPRGEKAAELCTARLGHDRLIILWWPHEFVALRDCARQPTAPLPTGQAHLMTSVGKGCLPQGASCPCMVNM